MSEPGSMWDKIDHNTFRLSVFGGWIVKHEYTMTNIKPVTFEQEITHYESMVFVPDPNHEWELT